MIKMLIDLLIYEQYPRRGRYWKYAYPGSTRLVPTKARQRLGERLRRARFASPRNNELYKSAILFIFRFRTFKRNLRRKLGWGAGR